MNVNYRPRNRTTEAKVFRHYRILFGMTTRQLAKALGCSNTLVTFYESREEKYPIPKKRREQMIKLFGLTEEDLEAFTLGKKQIPVNYKDEAMLLLSKAPENIAQVVYGMLINVNL